MTQHDADASGVIVRLHRLRGNCPHTEGRLRRMLPFNMGSSNSPVNFVSPADPHSLVPCHTLGWNDPLAAALKPRTGESGHADRDQERSCFTSADVGFLSAAAAGKDPVALLGSKPEPGPAGRERPPTQLSVVCCRLPQTSWPHLGTAICRQRMCPLCRGHCTHLQRRHGSESLKLSPALP